jgi:hypothetical protein
VTDTRFNLRYMRSISDILGSIETFRREKVTFKNLTKSEGELGWSKRSVQATAAATSSTAYMGAAYIFGFQLMPTEYAIGLLITFHGTVVIKFDSDTVMVDGEKFENSGQESYLHVLPAIFQATNYANYSTELLTMEYFKELHTEHRKSQHIISSHMG